MTQNEAKLKDKVMKFYGKVDHAVTAANDKALTWEEAYYELKAQYIIYLEDQHM